MHSGSRLSDLPSAPSLSPSRGTSPATGLLADRRSRTWPFAAGWALVGCGLAFWGTEAGSRFGPLLTAAGFAWFLPEWNNPAIDSSLAFTIGLCLYAACPPLVAHAVLAYPSGRLGSHTERGVVVSLTWAACSSSASCPPLVYDRQARGCNQCPSNLLTISDREALSTELNRVGVYLGVAWALGLTALALVKLARASVWARAVSRPALAT